MRETTLLDRLPSFVKTEGSACGHAHTRMTTDNRALAWPRLSHNLTCVPRRPQHRLSSQAGCTSWRYPLAPKLPTSRYHIPAPNPEIAAQSDDAQVTPPVSKESPSSPQRDPEPPPARSDPPPGPGPGPAPAPERFASENR